MIPRPSSASVWTICLGYLRMIAAYPEQSDTDNEVREDGTACHWLAEVYLRDGVLAPVGSLSPNNRIITEEMHDAVHLYAGVVRGWLVEFTVNCDFLYPGMVGTADAHAIDREAKLLDIGDLKYGFRFVDVYRNLQLSIYAAALLIYYGVEDWNDWTIRLTIVQPRNWHRDGHVRSWTFAAADLIPLMQWLQQRAALTQHPDSQCTANPGCVDCSARHACEAYMRSCESAMQLSAQAVPYDLPAPAVAAELDRLKYAIDQLEGRVTGLQSQAESILRKGGVVPGYAMRSKEGNMRWKDDTTARAVAHVFGGSIDKQVATITPRQAIDRKIIPEDFVLQHSERVPMPMKLVKLDPKEVSRKFDRSKK